MNQAILTSAELRVTFGQSCPRCSKRCRLRVNFCGWCRYLVNPAGYFYFLANGRPPC